MSETVKVVKFDFNFDKNLVLIGEIRVYLFLNANAMHFKRKQTGFRQKIVILRIPKLSGI